MRSTSGTLRPGDLAPEFKLTAVNRVDEAAERRLQQFSLGELVARGPVLLEFLRGTW